MQRDNLLPFYSSFLSEIIGSPVPVVIMTDITLWANILSNTRPLKAEQHPVVICAMFCSLFQIVVSFFERINMHLKENFLRIVKISFKFE